jgi:UrcA family protein
MNLSIGALIVTLGVVTLGTGVYAATDSSDGFVRGQVAVRHGDLNLSNERDARIMLRRIDRAAIDACGGQHPFGLYDGSTQQEFERCRADAVARTVAKLAAPMLTRIYADAYSSMRRS